MEYNGILRLNLRIRGTTLSQRTVCIDKRITVDKQTNSVKNYLRSGSASLLIMI